MVFIKLVKKQKRHSVFYMIHIFITRKEQVVLEKTRTFLHLKKLEPIDPYHLFHLHIYCADNHDK